MALKRVALTVNGRRIEAEVEPRASLADFLRERERLTGTNLGCEHGVCGACTIEVDGAPARSCITLAVACEGASVRTIEGFDGDPVMEQLRAAFTAEHALQCGYCTPGMLMLMTELLRENPNPDRETIRLRLNDNICRCTGYEDIVNSVVRAVELMRGETAVR
jgi:carbon-monoxide dehydrogenase small subunit